MTELHNPGDEFWWRRALCREIGGDFFFFVPGEQGQEAKRACRMCPVRQECLADEIGYEDQAEGIFAGFNQSARERMHHRVARGADPQNVARRAIAREQP